MSDPGTPTLDQLRVFLTVVEVGSFAGAARRLGRATSVISYSIANLEAQLGVLLFDREPTRKPQLTEAGRAVLSEARTVTNGINGLRAKVKGLLHGLEAEIHLVLDVMLPASRVVDALKAFRAEFPTVSLRLYVEALGAVAAVRCGRLQRSVPLFLCGRRLSAFGPRSSRVAILLTERGRQVPALARCPGSRVARPPLSHNRHGRRM